jgi:ferredoxin-type protein NapH
MNAATKILSRAPAPSARGRLAANRWLLLRRATQCLVLALFLAGPLLGVWVIRGNLSSSTTLGVLPLTDPYVLLQSFAAGALPSTTALLGTGIVVAFYLALGGRAYCAWVCPMNAVTDAAAWLRPRLGFRSARAPSPALRWWLLAGTLVVAFASGALAWELVNPVSMLHRALIFGGGLAWSVVAAVFLFDLLVAHRGFCGHVCPQGAFYALLGKFSLVRVSAHRRADCNDCADCYAVCPEPAVIPPALKPRDPAASPIVASGACTNCGRCIDVCGRDVFRFTHRFDRRSPA